MRLGQTDLRSPCTSLMSPSTQQSASPPSKGSCPALEALRAPWHCPVTASTDGDRAPAASPCPPHRRPLLRLRGNPRGGPCTAVAGQKSPSGPVTRGLGLLEEKHPQGFQDRNPERPPGHAWNKALPPRHASPGKREDGAPQGQLCSADTSMPAGDLPLRGGGTGPVGRASGPRTPLDLNGPLFAPHWSRLGLRSRMSTGSEGPSQHAHSGPPANSPRAPPHVAEASAIFLTGLQYRHLGRPR